MKSLRAAILLCAVASLTLPVTAVGHSPTPMGNGTWVGLVNDGPSYFKWGGTGSQYTTWFKNEMENVLEVKWATIDEQNSDSIRFQYASSGAATVFRQNTTDVTECNSGLFQGCAWLTGWTWKIWIRNTGWTFCQASQVNGCLDVQRVGIHEAAHIGGYINDHEGSVNNTVMQSQEGVEPYPDSGWNDDHLRRCDMAAMQIRYGEEFLSGDYADCFDHVPNACPSASPVGMCTDLSAGPASSSVCAGQAVVISGRLDISSNHYGRLKSNGTYELDGNALEQRLVTIKRSGAADLEDAASGSSGNNWQKVITAPSPMTITTYNYTAQFIKANQDFEWGNGLASSPVRSFSIQVIPAAMC